MPTTSVDARIHRLWSRVNDLRRLQISNSNLTKSHMAARQLLADTHSVTLIFIFLKISDQCDSIYCRTRFLRKAQKDDVCSPSFVIGSFYLCNPHSKNWPLSLMLS
jgi:hypothetical protein